MAPPSSRDLQRALWSSVASIVWTVLAGTSEVVLGIRGHVLSLVVFGLAGTLDAAASGTLALHFWRARHHETFDERLERRAARLVGAGLLVLGAVTALVSGRRLLTGAGHGESALGTVLAALSIPVLAALATVKVRLGPVVESAALRADGWLSASEGVLAVLVVVGGLLVQAGVAWADAGAALLIALGIAIYGVTVVRRG